MPYEMREQDGRWCVWKNGDAEPLKCYDAESAAQDYLTALNLNVDKARKAMRFDQAEAAYVPLSPSATAACANCRFFDAWDSACLIVMNYPLDILPTGWCKQHTPLPVPAVEEADEGDDEPTVEVMLSTGEAARELVVPDPPPGVKMAPVAMWAVATPPGEAADVMRAQMSEQQKAHDAAVDAEAAGKAANARALSLVASIKAKLNDTLFRRAEAEHSGFKTYGDRWVAWYSNNAKDRDGEFFPVKAIDAYIARVDAGIVPYPELWTYHIPGSKHGQAEWVGRVGHYVVAAGRFDDSPAGRAAKAHYARHRKSFALSHGFTYKEESYRDSAFWDFNTFEISTLPPRFAANPYTLFEIEEKAMLTPEKTAHLKTLFGEEIAAQIIAETEAKSKMLDELKVDFKDFVDIDAQKATTAAPQTEKALADLLADVIGESAEAVTMVSALGKMIKSYSAQVDQRLAEYDAKMVAWQDKHQAEVKHLREQIDLRPRIASKSPETLAEDGDERVKAVTEAARKEAAARFWKPEP